MKTLKPLLRTLMIPGMLCLGACCSMEDVVVAPPAPAPAPAPAPVPAPTPAPKPAPVVAPPISDIYFDFDKSLIRRDAVSRLEIIAGWMKNNPTKSVVIEAHSDEKGTSKYNRALGQRRANAARDYLVKHGVKASRVKAVSYGKEKPFVTGSNDKALAQNRRVHFVVE